LLWFVIIGSLSFAHVSRSVHALVVHELCHLSLFFS
jgi:hypothetical protein